MNNIVSEEDLIECPECGELVEGKKFIEGKGMCRDCYNIKIGEEPIEEPENE